MTPQNAVRDATNDPCKQQLLALRNEINEIEIRLKRETIGFNVTIGDLRGIHEEFGSLKNAKAHVVLRCLLCLLAQRSCLEYLKKQLNTIDLLERGESPDGNSGCVDKYEEDSHIFSITHSLKTRFGYAIQGLAETFSPSKKVVNQDRVGREEGYDLRVEIPDGTTASQFGGGPENIGGRYMSDAKSRLDTQTGTHSRTALNKTIEAADREGFKPAIFRWFGESKISFDKNGVLYIIGQPLWEILGLGGLHSAIRHEQARIFKELKKKKFMRVEHKGEEYDIGKLQVRIAEMYEEHAAKIAKEGFR